MLIDIEPYKLLVVLNNNLGRQPKLLECLVCGQHGWSGADDIPATGRLEHLKDCALGQYLKGEVSKADVVLGPKAMHKKDFDFTLFYEQLNHFRELRGATWTQVSGITGVSDSTLSRMRQGRKPDAASLASLASWAGINPAKCVKENHHVEHRSEDSSAMRGPNS